MEWAMSDVLSVGEISISIVEQEGPFLPAFDGSRS